MPLHNLYNPHFLWLVLFITPCFLIIHFPEGQDPSITILLDHETYRVDDLSHELVSRYPHLFRWHHHFRQVKSQHFSNFFTFCRWNPISKKQKNAHSSKFNRYCGLSTMPFLPPARHHHQWVTGRHRNCHLGGADPRLHGPRSHSHPRNQRFPPQRIGVKM